MTHWIRRSTWAALAALLALAPVSSAAQQQVRLAVKEGHATFSASGDSVILSDAVNYGGLRVDINGAIGGGSTITIACSVDGTTYDAIPLNGPYPAVTADTDGAVTAEGQYTATLIGCQKVRALASAWGTGTPVVTLYATGQTPSLGGSAAGGAGTEYTEADTDASITGVAMLWEDAADTLRAVSATKPLPVNVVAGGAAGGTSSNFGAAIPAAGTAIGGSDGTNMQLPRVYDDDTGAGTNYNLGVGIRAQASGGSVAIPGDAANGLDVDVTRVSGTVTVSATNLDVQIGGSDTLAVGNVATIGTSVTPGTAAANLGKAEDALAATGDTGVAMLAVAEATPSATAGNGDYITPKTNANGVLWTQPISVGVEDAGETAGGNLEMAGSVRRDVAASSAGTTGDNATVNTDSIGLLWARLLDPCSGVAKTFLPFNITTATTTEITPSLAGASTNYYVCSMIGVTAAANNVAIVDDDTDNCASVTAGMAGGTSAASGFNFAANGGFAFGDGNGSIMKTNGTNRVICLVTSAATQLSGVMSVVAAP